MSPSKGRILGLDLGTKTLGLAISDTTQTIASCYKTLRFDSEDYDSLLPKLNDIVQKESITLIVLGFPKNMNNTVGPRGEATLEFKKKIETNLNIKVIMQDERLSTVSAINVMLDADISRKKRKQKVDSIAANIILQTYLDCMKGR